MNPPIRFIGHPMIDVGVATLCAAAGVQKPDDLTPEAIEAFTQEIVDLYISQAMSKFLTFVVFAGARFANPAHLDPKNDAKRRAVLADVIQQWKPDVPPSQHEVAAAEGEVCTFSGDPAKLRVSRLYIPMITSETNPNFMPEGVPLLPISGWCLLALFAMPMGGLASKGKMWIVHSPDPDATLYFAKRNLARNRADFQREGLNKRPNYKFARTYLLRDLSEAYKYRLARTNYPITVYHFTSSNQKSEIDILQLSSPALRFISEASRHLERDWNEVVKRAEQLNTQTEEKDGAITYQDRNYFYEDLFDLPRNAHQFLRRYLMRDPLKGKPTGEAKNDPRYRYSFVEEANLVSWSLTSLFLKEIMQMNEERIEAIKTVADRIAQYIQEQDSRLFNQIFNARTEYDLRLALIRASSRASAPLFTLDEYIDAFFTEGLNETLRSDWLLTRDLIVIRIIEKLYESNKVEIVKSAAAEADTAEASAS